MNKLYVFDFDGTLCDSPLPDFGKLEYQRITGLPYPHKGWWGREESLDKMFDIKPMGIIIPEYERATATGTTLMMTNRMSKHETRIKEILDGHKLYFTHYNLKNDNRGKMSRLDAYLRYWSDKGFSYVEIWDDMDQHIDDFQHIRTLYPKIEFVVNKVNRDEIIRDIK